jgi:hypothetical protein
VFPTFFLSGCECSTFDWHGVGRRDLTAETLVRIPDPEYIAEIRRWQALLNQSDHLDEDPFNDAVDLIDVVEAARRLSIKGDVDWS